MPARVTVTRASTPVTKPVPAIGKVIAPSKRLNIIEGVVLMMLPIVRSVNLSPMVTRSTRTFAGKAVALESGALLLSASSNPRLVLNADAPVAAKPSGQGEPQCTTVINGEDEQTPSILFPDAGSAQVPAAIKYPDNATDVVPAGQAAVKSILMLSPIIDIGKG